MLSANKISFEFQEGDIILDHISLSVAEGEIVSIVGPSGAGKTTLLKCLAGQLQLKEGTIKLDDEIVKGPEDQLLNGHDEIAIVDQDFSLDLYFSVYENIENQLLHLTQKDKESFTLELLTVFGLEEIQHQPSKYISGGEKQRLSMACALAQEPKYLLLDEPFSNLDVHLKRSIGIYIRKLQEMRGMGVVLVTHEGVDALSWSDKIYFLKNKQKLTKYSPQTAYHSPKTLYEGRFFGQLNSVYHEGRQILFRPTEYELKSKEGTIKVELSYLMSDFHGHFYANYFKLASGKEVVLYSDQSLKNVTEIYV